jgi:hypothetical protein
LARCIKALFPRLSVRVVPRLFFLHLRLGTLQYVFG